MSHRNTPSKTKAAAARNNKKPGKAQNAAPGSPRGGTKQDVLRLMTSLKLVESWTGISPGFAPLRMRSM